MKFPKKPTGKFKWALSIMMVALLFFQFKLGECSERQITLKTEAINEFIQADIYNSRINTGLSQSQKEDDQNRSDELEQEAYALRGPRDVHIQQGYVKSRDANNVNCNSWRNTSLVLIAAMFILTLLNKKGDA